LKEMPQGLFWLSVPIMAIGAWLMLSENHDHHHIHEQAEHIHNHAHPDEHHDHPHLTEAPLVNGAHAHPHQHEMLAHDHPHTPDLHHRHTHEMG
jgi:hypothetical protein